MRRGFNSPSVLPVIRSDITMREAIGQPSSGIAIGTA